MKAMIVAAAMLSGCIGAGSGQPQIQTPAKASYLCVGMETSKRFGSCPGCELDAKRLTSLMKTCLGYDGKTLISGQATKSAVVDALKKGIEDTPEDGLFLFFYSGHGGQEYLGGKEPDGADRADEYLCLYDTHMLDDEIWEIASKCRGRVFMYFDACHSATMYRSVAAASGLKKGVASAMSANPEEFIKSKGFTFRPDRFVGAQALDGASAKSPRILCWSGCKEEEYSYGGNSGGALTIAVIRNWKKDMSYGDLWDKARKDVNKSQPTQHPVQTSVGAFKPSVEAFR